jgi:MraZ protein
MFLGSFKYSVDSKGRIALPAKLRKSVNSAASDRFVITRGTDKNIDIYPSDFWDELTAAKLNSLNTFDPNDMLFIRMFLQEATEETLDSQSRIILPKNLKEYASIENDVLIIGAVKKIEVWSPIKYEEYLAKVSKSYEEIAFEVMKK